jgi:hypothetical protein
MPVTQCLVLEKMGQVLYLPHFPYALETATKTIGRRPV